MNLTTALVCHIFVRSTVFIYASISPYLMFHIHFLSPSAISIVFSLSLFPSRSARRFICPPSRLISTFTTGTFTTFCFVLFYVSLEPKSRIYVLSTVVCVVSSLGIINTFIFLLMKWVGISFHLRLWNSNLVTLFSLWFLREFFSFCSAFDR